MGVAPLYDFREHDADLRMFVADPNGAGRFFEVHYQADELEFTVIAVVG